MIRFQQVSESRKKELAEELSESEFRQVIEGYYCSRCMKIWYQCKCGETDDQ